MSTNELRGIVGRMQDGMTVNREKLARECLAVCDASDRLERQLASEREKNAELTRLLEKALKNSNPGEDIFKGMGSFGEAFGDIFKPTGQHRT